MFDPGEEIKAHGDIDYILRGEEEVPRRVPNSKDRDWDEAETLFPAPVFMATASMFSHRTRC